MSAAGITSIVPRTITKGRRLRSRGPLSVAGERRRGALAVMRLRRDHPKRFARLPEDLRWKAAAMAEHLQVVDELSWDRAADLALGRTEMWACRQGRWPATAVVGRRAA